MYIASLIGILVIAADFITKYLVHTFLPLMNQSNGMYPYGGIGVFKNVLGVEFSITHATNTGAAWSLFSDFPHALLWLRIGLIVILAGYLYKQKSLKLQIALSLILAGAIGNVIDYFVYGHVVDMFHAVLWGYDYPVFNIADSAIFIGIGLYLIFSWLPTHDTARTT